jgi:hypothetical protein
VSIDVFEFRSPTGPATLVQAFTTKPEPGYARASINGIPASQTMAGTSPEGRTTLGVAFAHGRFLVGVLVGGSPGGHSYPALLDDVAHAQLVRLPNVT